MPLAAQTAINLTAAAVREVSDFANSTFTDRAWPLDERTELPAARVLAEDEEVEQGSIHAPPLELHNLDIEVELYVSAASALDDAMHAATASVLASVYGSTAAAARLAAGVQAFATQRIERRMADRGAARVGVVSILLRARFAVIANAPESIVF